MTISLAVKSSFEYSAALAAHIERRIDHALRTHAGTSNALSCGCRMQTVPGTARPTKWRASM